MYVLNSTLCTDVCIETLPTMCQDQCVDCACGCDCDGFSESQMFNNMVKECVKVGVARLMLYEVNWP